MAVAALRPLSGLHSPRVVIRRFMPDRFAATMGSGILALALAQIPRAGHALAPLVEALRL